MICITISLAFLILSVSLHLLWCRYSKRQGLHLISLMIICFLFLSLLVILTVSNLGASSRGSSPDLWNMPLALTAILFYLLSLFVYFVLFTITVIDSPSKYLTEMVRNQGPLTYQQILGKMGGDNFIMSRLKTLVSVRYVENNGSRYKLTTRGRLLARILNVYQRVCGRAWGG